MPQERVPHSVERTHQDRQLLEESRSANAALREIEQQLWRAQRLQSLGVLAGGIAHDLNNILAGISGYVDLIKIQLAPPHPVRNDLDAIKAAVQRAADLTRQMLAYAGKGKSALVSVNVSRVVEDTRKFLEASLSRQTRLQFNLAAELPCIQADESQIHQVILNLVVNASEALGVTNGLVAVSTSAITLVEGDCLANYEGADLLQGCFVCLEVSDTGCGMDQETTNKIFEPFFTTKVSGRGLGLAAVCGIVRSHQGAIQVHSTSGQGTTFRVLFPVSDPAAHFSTPDRHLRSRTIAA